MGPCGRVWISRNYVTEQRKASSFKKKFRVLLGEGFEFGEREDTSRGNGL